MSGSVRKKAVSRQALAKQDSIRAEPKRAQWSKQEYTTEEIIKQCSLPQIVKCSGGAISPQLDKPLPINFSEPIMLYDTRTNTIKLYNIDLEIYKICVKKHRYLHSLLE
jgi:hypothetical protein